MITIHSLNAIMIFEYSSSTEFDNLENCIVAETSENLDVASNVFTLMDTMIPGIPIFEKYGQETIV